MLNLQKLIPLKLKEVKNLGFANKPASMNNAVVLYGQHEDVVNIINSELFKRELIKSYFTKFNIRDTLTNRTIHLPRETYATIREATYVNSCPTSTTQLKGRNLFMDISTELNLILDNKTVIRSKTKDQAPHLIRTLNSAFDGIYKNGYTNEIDFVIELNKDEFSKERSVLNTLLFVFRYSIALDTPGLKTPVNIIFKTKGRNTIFHLPYKFDGSSIPMAQFTRLVSLLNVQKKFLENKKLTASDKSLISELSGNTLPEDKSAETEDFYICTDDYQSDLKYVNAENPKIVFNTHSEAVISAYETHQHRIDNKKLKTDMYKVLETNGFKLFKILDPAAITGGKYHSIEGKVKVEPVTKSLSTEQISKTDMDDFFIEGVYNSITGKIVSKAVSANEDDQEHLTSIYNRISELVANGSTDYKEMATQISQDMEVLAYLEEIKANRITAGKNVVKQNLTSELSNRQDTAKVTIDGKEQSVKDFLQEIDDQNIAKEVKIDTSFDYMKENVSDNIDNNYAQKYMKQDILNIFSGFNQPDAEPPIFMTDVQVEDTSDPFNFKDTYVVTFNIPERKPQKLRIDVPKFSADGYIFTHGSKKSVTKQLITLPITYIRSSGEDAVQFTTNYNKVFIERNGQRTSANLTKLIKVMQSEYNQKVSRIKSALTVGNAKSKNHEYVNTIEYNEMSKYFIKIKVKHDEFVFDRVTMDDLLYKAGYTKIAYPGVKQNLIPFGVRYNTKKDIEGLYLFGQDGKVYFTKSTNTEKPVPAKDEVGNKFYKFMLDQLAILDQSVYEKFGQEKTGKRFVYSRIKVVGRRIPLICFLGWRVGLTKLLEMYGVDHEFTTSNKSTNPERFDNTIRFKDYFLHFDGTLRNSILLNGLIELSPQSLDVVDFEAKGDAYINFFVNMGASNLGKALNNFHDLFIDPITKEVLEDLNLPTDMTEAFLYCNTMLESSVTLRKNNMANYRVRGAEAITAMLYKEISGAVKSYRDTTSTAGNAKPLSVKSDALMNALLASPIIEELALMNPVKEARNRSKTTYKGPAGTNLGHARGTEEIREYDESMVGLLTPTTTDDPNTGITRFLAINPTINGKRGFIDTSKRDTNASNILNMADIISPYTATRADPPRQGMQAGQTGHMIPTVKMTKPLISCGADKAVKYSIGNDFAFKAVQDGTVKEIDDKNGLVIIEYKDGSTAAIDLGIKNGRVSDGYFITIQLKHELKVGQKFKANDILALDPQYFTQESNPNNSSLMAGRLTRMAIAPMDVTYEDSSAISTKLQEDLASYVTFDKKVTIGANANIISMKKVGDHVKTAESILTFEEVFGDTGEGVSKMLDKLGAEFADSISEFSKSTVPSKVTGDIVDIRIYYNREMEEYSPSIQKLLKGYQKQYNDKAKKLQKTRKDHIVFIPQVEKVNTNRVAGTEFDGVMLHYFVRTKDSFGVGDKVACQVALKTIVGSVFKEDQEPVTIDSATSVGGGQEGIDLVLSPFSTASRMVHDCWSAGYTQKALVLLTKRIENILDS